MASQEASWEIDSKASFPQAPYDSTTNGTQTQSSSLHLVSLDEYFLSSVVSAATPVITLASKRVVGLIGDVTDRSKLLACPRPSLELKGQLDGCGCDW